MKIKRLVLKYFSHLKSDSKVALDWSDCVVCDLFFKICSNFSILSFLFFSLVIKCASVCIIKFLLKYKLQKICGNYFWFSNRCISFWREIFAFKRDIGRSAELSSTLVDVTDSTDKDVVTELTAWSSGIESSDSCCSAHNRILAPVLKNKLKLFNDGEQLSQAIEISFSVFRVPARFRHRAGFSLTSGTLHCPWGGVRVTLACLVTDQGLSQRRRKLHILQVFVVA